MLSQLNHFSSLLLIVGLSGAGKTTVIGQLDDLGYYCVDSLPVSFIREFLIFSATTGSRRFKQTALLVDIDSEDSTTEFLKLIDEIGPLPTHVKLVFLEATTNTIVRRYSETRRPHPLVDPENDKSLTDTIQRERALLIRVKERANFSIDTSELTGQALRQEVRKYIESIALGPVGRMRVNFLSFGFKHGAPFDCDLILDVRFIKNPFFVEGLREKTGIDAEVARYVLDLDESKEFLTRTVSYLNFLLPLYVKEGKAYVNIGLGCTGGQHRSVAIAEELRSRITVSDTVVSVKHRDLSD